MGRLADRLGARRVFRAGLPTVATACTAATMAPAFGWVVGCRGAPGPGASVAFPAGMSSIRARSVATDGESPTRVMSVVVTVNALAAAVGQLAGGVLVSAGGWRAVFVANVPVALLAAPLAGRLLPPVSRRAAPSRPGESSSGWISRVCSCTA